MLAGLEKVSDLFIYKVHLQVKNQPCWLEVIYFAAEKGQAWQMVV